MTYMDRGYKGIQMPWTFYWTRQNVSLLYPFGEAILRTHKKTGRDALRQAKISQIS